MRKVYQRGRWLIGLLGLLIVSLAVSGFATAAPSNQHGSPTPDGFDKYLVYMGAGLYDPDAPDYTPPDGTFFHKEIMGRTDAEIEQNRADAIAFFEERFGIDPTTHEGVTFSSFMLDPRNEYRAYTVSGEFVPSSGWVVRDGGWRVDVVDPDGITLGGEFEGVHVPQGSLMVFGDYNIRRLGPGASGDNPAHAEPIIIHYQSGEPIVPNPTGGIMFRCEIIHPEFGQGLAQGISAPQTLPDGRVQANIRNILTFPGLGDNQ